MKNKIPLFLSLFALVGQFLYFLIVSLYTGEFRYMIWSFMVSMIIGVPSLIKTLQKTNKGDQNSNLD